MLEVFVGGEGHGGPLDADVGVCLQPQAMGTRIQGSETCLYIDAGTYDLYSIIMYLVTYSCRCMCEMR